jgi:hypothetical protein
MPFDYEVGGVINIPGVAGFMAWGSIGYDMVFWILKELVPGNFPTSFLRYGAGVGYQTPIENLQVKLAYKKNGYIRRFKRSTRKWLYTWRLLPNVESHFINRLRQVADVSLDESLARYRTEKNAGSFD